ncbi:MAG: NAD(P)/FAD-dependent oxidoreductase [Pseudomonadota bacterium]
MLDVVIIGAGVSGVGAARYMKVNFPEQNFAILEARKAVGGTWDLFRYPGIRSDSDMFTFGYRFKPWREARAIADGPSILSYVNETVDENDLRNKIEFDSRVVAADWSSDEAAWTLTVQADNGSKRAVKTRFIWSCTGYYRYDAGYTPQFEGVEDFKGRLVHPQMWPSDLDYAGKRVVVIGSGATAVTLVPSMAEKTAHITMLQRSPTYMFARPGTSAVAAFLRRVFPETVAYRMMRWWRICFQNFLYKFARHRPAKAREQLIEETREKLKPGFDVDRHFSPTYNPWDQRICYVPDDDLFNAINDGKASVVTEQIDRFVENGVRLKNGDVLEADIVITATGLSLQVFGGAELRVDGETIKTGEKLNYRGLMLEAVPNFVFIIGYINASWTLRVDLVADFMKRLFGHMKQTGANVVTPVNPDPSIVKNESMFGLTSGYVKRALDIMPKQGPDPWRHDHDYFKDVFAMRHAKINDGVLQFNSVATKRNETASGETLAAAE